MKILLIDIETSPNLVWTWGLYKQDIRPAQIVETSRTLCFAWKWLDKKRIHFLDERDGHEEMIQRAWELLDEADAVLHFNGARFDVPALNKEFLKYGMRPPAPFKQIDLYKVAKKHFRFPSNKLEHLLNELQLDGKVEHSGFRLWLDCLAGDASAWRRMKRYNKQDVRQMEPLYEMLLPWIDNHPNRALYVDTDAPCCPNCGSEALQRRGKARTKTRTYQRLHCTACGRWSRERLNNTENLENVVVQAI